MVRFAVYIDDGSPGSLVIFIDPFPWITVPACVIRSAHPGSLALLSDPLATYSAPGFCRC